MKKALVISGGGSKGAFAVGVIKDLANTYHLGFDVVVGTSTGALIAPLAAMGDIASLEQLYTTVTNKDIVVKYEIGDRLFENSIFTAGPLTEKIKALYTDAFFNKLNASGKEVYLTTVCLQTEELVIFTNAKNPVEKNNYTVRKLVNGDQFRRAILASASQPVFFPPVKVNKNVPGELFPEDQFVDGGVREYAGLGIAMNSGATEIFTILHASKVNIPKHDAFNKMVAILQQTVAMFITDVSDNDLWAPLQLNNVLKYIDAVKAKMKAGGLPQAQIDAYFNVGDVYKDLQYMKPVKIHVIQPQGALGGGPGGLDFNPTEMKDMLVKGQFALNAYVATLKPGDVD